MFNNFQKWAKISNVWNKLFPRISFTSKPFCRIGRLTFQSILVVLEIRSHLFESHCYHAEWIKLLSECSGGLDEITRFAWSYRNRNTMIEFYSLAFFWLAIFTCWLLSFGRQKKIDFSEKRSHGSLSPFSIRFASPNQFFRAGNDELIYDKILPESNL